MVALLLILRDCGVTAKNTFKHFLRSDRPQLSSACTKNQLSNVPSEIFNLKRNRPRNLHKQICNFVSKLCEPVANCSAQTANQNTNIVAEVCKVARKRTSSLTVIDRHSKVSCLFSLLVIAPFNNMWNLKFQSPSTVSFFAANNHNLNIFTLAINRL